MLRNVSETISEANTNCPLPEMQISAPGKRQGSVLMPNAGLGPVQSSGMLLGFSRLVQDLGLYSTSLTDGMGRNTVGNSLRVSEDRKSQYGIP